MFVWVFHRISGLLLIVLLFVQLFTGYFQATAADAGAARTAAALHKLALLNCVLVFLLIFHAFYGLRTILLDLGVRREKLLFWAFTAAGAAAYVAFLVGYWTHLAA